MALKGTPMAKIFVRGPKLWIDYRANGKRVRRSTGLDDTPANRRTLEKEVIPALMARIKLGQLSPKQSRLFKDYAAEFLRMKEREKSYTMKLPTRRKIIAHFGGMRVDEITRLDIKRYLMDLPIKSSSKRLYLSTIRGILDLALDDDVIDRNPADGIRLPKEPKPEAKPFSPQEVEAILSRADGMLRNYLGIAFYTGLRSGEILGLMHQDIGADTITVRRSISKGRITTPKTAGSLRTIPIFAAARPFIEDQKKRSNSLYLFDIDGAPISDIGVLRKRKWARLLRDCGIEYRKIYATRHTFITAMLNSGRYKLTTIARIVGHTSIETLVENYAGFIKDEHLQIDTELDIFGHNLDTVGNFEGEKKA